MLLAAEAIGGIRILRCRAAHLVAERWTAIERREQRGARRAELAALTRGIIRRHDLPAAEPEWPRAGATRPMPAMLRGSIIVLGNRGKLTLRGTAGPEGRIAIWLGLRSPIIRNG